jgi:hypothetical protein
MLIWEGGKVNVSIGTELLAGPASTVDQARDHLFAHARFAEDQDFGIRSCRFANLP